METKKLNRFKIEFYSEEEFKNCIKSNEYDELKVERNITILSKITDYAGLVSEIKEELAKQIIKGSYLNFKQPFWNANTGYLPTAKESFKTLSDFPYCVISQIN